MEDTSGRLDSYQARGSGQSLDGSRYRGTINRRYVDHHQAMLNYIQARPFQFYDQHPQNVPGKMITLFPPFTYENAATSLTTKFIVHVKNKNTTTTAQKMDFDQRQYGNKTEIVSLAWPPDGRRLITAHSDGLLVFWEIGNGPKFEFLLGTTRTNQPTELTDAAWSPSYDFMAAVDITNRMSFYQVNSNKITDVILDVPPNESNISSLCFSPNGRKLIFATAQSVYIWDVRSQSREREFNEHGTEVNSIAWHPSASVVATADKNGKIIFSDPREAKKIHILTAHNKSCRKIRWNSNGNWLLSAGEDAKIHVTDRRMMRTIRSFRSGNQSAVNCISWNPMVEDHFVSGDDTGEIRWWAMSSDEPLEAMPNAHEKNKKINHLDFHPFGHTLASVATMGSLYFWARHEAGTEVEPETEGVVEPYLPKASDFRTDITEIPGLPPMSSL